MKFIPHNLKKELKSHFVSLREDTGVWITIYGEPNKQDCPNCLSDHQGISTGVFDSSFTVPVLIFDTLISPASFTRGRCPVCYGKGYLTQDNTTEVKALIHWNPPDEMARGDFENTPGGLEGRNVVRAKVDKKYYNLIRDCEKAVVDNIECILLRPPVLRSVQYEDVMVTAYFVSDLSGHDVRPT